jgi:hypothetical protein
MAWQERIQTVNRRTQLGVESTSALGTAVACNKLIECFDWTYGIDADVSMFGSSGHKYDEVQQENWEQSTIDVSGNMDFNGVCYLLPSTMGSVNPAAHLASSTAKDWIFTPPVSGSIVPQTYTLQAGDAVRAFSLSYGLFNSFGYKGTRKTPFTVSAKGFGQQISDGITLTANPTAVALSPVVGKFFNVYLDTSSGGLGTTLLTSCYSMDFSFDNIYGVFYPINRANASFTGHIDLKPKATLKLILETDAVGLAGMQSTYLQGGATAYVRVQAQGNQIANDGPGSIKATFQHDMACKVGKPSAFKDEQGIYAVEWELTVIEDPSWSSGQAQQITVTNLIAAL